jgi:cysteine desulfuration protein SufE
MASFVEKESDLESRFNRLPDWELKYKYIMSLGEKAGTLPEEDKSSEKLVRGCQSQVWLIAEPTKDLEGKIESIQYHTDSDSAITKGLAALVAEYYSGEAPEDIVSQEPTFLAKIGLDTHLSPTRSNGILAMVRQIKQLAVVAMS